MVIHAIYKDGVFRPLGGVELPDDCEVDLTIKQSRPQAGVNTSIRPLAAIAAIASQHPENPQLPPDLAQQHDHYLYGTPKQP